MEHNTEYIVEVEYQVERDNIVIDSSVSYIKRIPLFNPINSFEYFSQHMNTSYTNLYGIKNSAIVRAVYKKEEY